jgi:predicted phage terminase large subunit-like protein
MNEIVLDEESMLAKARLLGSLLLFIQTFFKILNGREFTIPQPIGRESHVITICRALTRLFYLEIDRLNINIPPGDYKSTIVSYFTAWAYAHYADCHTIYVSYGQELAATHTAIIKSVMELPYYRKLFGVEIKRDTRAKDDFGTTAGGAIKAFGSSGPITGRNAGFSGCNRFSGMVVMDDMHKPGEVHSDTIREGVIANYQQTIFPRPRAPNVPMIFIGQRLHEGDLPQFLLDGKDGYKWESIVLKARDEVGNILNPITTTKQKLDALEKFSPYVYASQYQQNPIPAGGAIFKKNSFFLLQEDPHMLATFITADTAETEKKVNDATVFSFWGIYKINDFHRETEQFALHWIDCSLELRVKPSELESEFMAFYSRCMGYKVKPSFAAIEKKSTGVTLISILQNHRGLSIREIERNAGSGSKIDRFLNIESHVARGLISLPQFGSHTETCINHCAKITANNSHAHDDIADTMYDAIKIALIDKLVYTLDYQRDEDSIVSSINQAMHQQQHMRSKLYGH